jgi:hypothetical protein
VCRWIGFEIAAGIQILDGGGDAWQSRIPRQLGNACLDIIYMDIRNGEAKKQGSKNR